MENRYKLEAEVFCAAIKRLAENPENLDNLESYLSRHFPVWLKKYASTPLDITMELDNFSRMD